jgi:hypothetical protein
MKTIGRSLLMAALLMAALLLAPTAAHAATSGWVKGRLQFFQNQGNFCPTGRDCTGANYLQAQWHTNQPIPETVIVILDSSNRQIGSGSTGTDGRFLVRWTSTNTVTKGKVQWYAEHSGGRFNIRTGTGTRQVFTGATKSLTNGASQSNPTNWGDLRWGSSSSPHPVANVYDGAWKLWNFSAQFSSLAVTFFTGVEVRAFNSSCPTSCAGGKLVNLDTGGGTPYSPGARVMHELGHIVSTQTHQGNDSHPCLDYSFGGNSGWSLQSQEWTCAGFEEGYATFVGDVARYWNSAVAPDTCFPQTDACTTMLETSSTFSCDFANGEPRWPLSVMRFLWDSYDFRSDFEDVAEPYNDLVNNQNNFAIGTANHQRDEPFSGPGGSLADRDGKSNFDFFVNYSDAHPGRSLFAADTNNCSPPGD